MPKTIANTVTSSVTLTAAYDPLTVTGTGVISTTAIAAVYGNASQAWNITNAGKIENDGQFGIDLLSGSTVGNSGLVSDNQPFGEAVRISGGAGLVTNSGSILGAFDGVVLTAGGSVANTTARGTISGAANDGVYISGGAGTVTNAGQITGGVLAVQFKGDFADRVIIDPGASFTGTVQGGSGTNTLELAADPHGETGRLSDFATAFQNFGTIAVDRGANWQIDSTDTIASGIVLDDAGTLNSAAVIDTTATVVAGGSFANSGTVIAGSGKIGVTLLAGGVVSNSLANALIEGGRYGIRARGAAAVVTNAATIIGTSNLNGGGVGLYAGGSVTNTGTITGKGAAGIYIGGGAGTVTNAGTITGATDSVKFAGTSTDRVIMRPGAMFNGLVQGGAGYNILELAAGNPGGIGTLTNFATAFAGFGTITVDNGASWQFAAGNTIASPVHLDDDGVLMNAGVIDTEVMVAAGASLTNSGSIGNQPYVSGNETYTTSLSISLGAGASLTNSGTIGGAAGTNGLYLTDGGGVTNTGLIDKPFYVIGGGTVTNGGTILGYNGLNCDGSTTVTNTGRIFGAGNSGFTEGSGIYIADGAGAVTNHGTVGGLFDGVLLTDGGTVVNTQLIYADAGAGVYISGGAGTLTNAGTIDGGSHGDAVQFGGSFADRLIMTPGAVLNGRVQGGSGTNTLELAAGSAGGTGTLASLASFARFGTITIDLGAAWQFAASNTVAASVQLSDDGALTNAGSIASTAFVGPGASLTNSGTILVNNSYGVVILDGGTVTNTGLIENPGTGTDSGALLSNAAAGFVINAGGTIAGGSTGVVLAAGGTVLNKGVISGATREAVAVFGAAGTVTNAGTITGVQNQALAVFFGGSYTDRVIFDAGAVFHGAVQGGTGSNTLELAAGSAGVTGTLSAFATAFTNFGTIAIDAGTRWVFASSSTIGSTVTLTDAGILSNAGLIETAVTLTAATSLGNSGTIDGGSAEPGVAMLAGGTLVNSGLVEGTTGVSIAGGAGLVTNGSTITGATYGVDLSAGGTLHNTGAITSTSHGEAVQIAGGAGTLTNTSSLGGVFDGVVLTAGGTVQNSGAISGGNIGVYIGGGAATLTNSGTILGGAFAIEFNGSFADSVILDAGAAIQGKVQGGSGNNTLELAPGRSGVIGTLSSFAGAFTGFGTLAIDAGAHWSFAAGNTIGSGVLIFDSGTLANAGVIESAVNVTAGVSITNSGTIHTSGYGISMLVGGNLANTGLIEGANGVTIDSTGSITNSGSIIGTALKSIGVNAEGGISINNAGLIQGYYALVDASGRVTNSGTIAGGGDGIQLSQGGTVSNAGSGTILATAAGANDQGIFITGGAGSVTNAGLISAGAIGVVLADGGVVTNTGSIGGTSSIGVEISGAAGTITNAGTISGGALAVEFNGSFADRVIFDAGAVFQGAVQGGSGTNTLELAAGKSGSIGTLSLFASNFLAFDAIAVDAVANWTNAAGSTIASGVAITDAGTLRNAGAIDTTVRVTADRIFGNSGTIASSLGAGVTLQAGGTLTNSGLISGSQYGAVLQQGGTVDNLGSIVGTSAVGISIGGAAATVTNVGTITGSTDSIKFAGAFNNWVILDQGAVLQGSVQGGSGTNTLELAATGRSSSGTLANLGSEFSGFSQIDVDAAAIWSVTATNPFAGSTGLPAVSLAAQSTLSLTGGGALQADITGPGLLQLEGSTAFSLAAADTLDSALTIGAGAILSGTGTIGGAIDIVGTVSAASGTLAFMGPVTNQGTIGVTSALVSVQSSIAGTGALQIGATGTLALDLGAGAGQQVDFLAATGLLDLAAPLAFTGTISGFGSNARIDLLNTPETSYSYANNILTVQNGSTIVASLHFTDSSNSFSLTSDQHGGTFIVAMQP